MSQKYVGKQFRVKSHIDLGESYIEEGAVYYYLGETTGVDGTIYHVFCQEYYTNPRDAWNIANKFINDIHQHAQGGSALERAVMAEYLKSLMPNPYVFSIASKDDKQTQLLFDQLTDDDGVGGFLVPTD